MPFLVEVVSLEEACVGICLVITFAVKTFEDMRA